MLQSHSLMTMHPNILITLLSPEEGARGGAFPDIVLIEGGGGEHRGGALQRVLFHFLLSFFRFLFLFLFPATSGTRRNQGRDQC